MELEPSNRVDAVAWATIHRVIDCLDYHRGQWVTSVHIAAHLDIPLRTVDLLLAVMERVTNVEVGTVAGCVFYRLAGPFKGWGEGTT